VGPPSRARTALTVFVAIACTVAAVLPPFLLGGLASLIRADLGFDEAQLGLAVGTFYGASAACAVPGGRSAERLGARRALMLGLVMAVSSLAGIAVLARAWAHLLPFLALAGASNGITQSAASLAIARGVSQGRLGIAFGIKQSAVPSASLLAGLAVPFIGLTVGWRWAFAAGALAAIALLFALPTGGGAGATVDGSRNRHHIGFGRRELRSLTTIALASGCGAVAANSMGAFYVESAASAGHPLALAGVLLSVGSIAGIAIRLGLGAAADRLRFDPLRVVGGMMMLGTAGFLVLGYTRGVAWLVVGTLVAFTAGWGWPGLIQLAVVSEHMRAPAAASGIAHAGALTGGLLGPIVFGQIVTAAGYQAAWTAVAAVALCGGSLLWYERRGVQRAVVPAGAEGGRDDVDVPA
jgi:predicted MFS family arabinose efflux permease